MRVLWIVNMVLPKLAEHLNISGGLSGTWMFDISKRLSQLQDVELAVACVHGKTFQKYEIEGITYYCLPGNGRDMMFYNAGYETLWQYIYADFKPDIVNIHGTEYTHGLSFIRKYPCVKTVISLQGVIKRIQDVDLIGLKWWQILRYRTLREWLRFNGMLEMHLLHRKNAKSEEEMLKSVRYVMCVDDWHRAMALDINPKAKCFYVNYNLRDAFYASPKWSIENARRHTISTNPGGTPLKGLHNLLRAVAIVKEFYPDVLVKVPGMKQKNGELAPTSGYAIYLRNLIRKLGLQENVEFLGPQTEEQMLLNMRTAHVQVVPSAIEGPSLVLREGMHLGVPTIATFRGGMADFVEDKVNGFLYDYQEYPYLANRILEIFRDDELAKRLSANAIRKAEKAHDRENNLKDYYEMYTQILKDEGIAR